MDVKKHRRNLEKRYGQLYVRMFFREGEAQVCVYCGNVAETQDHVPPLDWVYCLGTSYFGSAGIRLLLVPACGECNVELGPRKLFTIKDRTRWLIGRYEKKYERFTKGLIWDMEDVDELGRGLKRYVEGHRTCQIGIERRIKILEEGLRRVP